MAAYYNENDPKTVVWLRKLIQDGLIADGEVDDRSIVDVQPEDIRGFAQCHFFAGIGGWSYALRLAGWPDDRSVWTGSCPCQPHSSASRGRKVAPDLWPEWERLIRLERPVDLLGEQVDEALSWLDGVWDDLEACGYVVWPAIIPAYSASFDHARERIYFAGHSYGQGQSIGALDEEMAWLQRARSQSRGVVQADGLPGRMDFLRGFGNAIVPQVAAAFIEAYIEVTDGFGVEPSTARPSFRGVLEQIPSKGRKTPRKTEMGEISHLQGSLRRDSERH